MSRNAGSDVMSAGPRVNVRRASGGSRPAAAGRRSPGPGRAGSRSPGRPGRAGSRSPGGRRVSSGRESREDGLPDREALADKLNEMSRKMREVTSESTLLKSRLQRAETESKQKDKTIDELLSANAGGFSDSSSLRRTQQQMIGTLKGRVGELETMLLEKEAALQTVANQPQAHALAEVEAERRAFYTELRRLQQLQGSDGGGGGGGAGGGGGGGDDAELRQLREEVGSLRMGRAELNEQLEWAQTDRDEALARISSLESELSQQRTALREGRSRMARLQVQLEQQQGGS
jgi:DNA repair exonuclease SbcCD ATPase subunit